MLLTAQLPATAQPTAAFETGLIGEPRLFRPAGDPRAMIFLFSDADGWTDDDDRLAASLVDEGALIVGVDLPDYLHRIGSAGGDCAYLVSDIESLSRQMQRASGSVSYFQPIVAGRGDGGALALAIAAQTPDGTIGQTLAVDPSLGVALQRELCTDAPRVKIGDRTIYGLAAEGLHDPVAVVFTPQADPASRDHIGKLVNQGYAITRTKATDAGSALSGNLLDLVAAETTRVAASVDLPIVELPATPTQDVLAIIYSGDGGWRDLDQTIGGLLQAKGVPTIGVDSLRYFWSRRDPDRMSEDLADLIRTYTEKWGVSRVILAGYSFGADVLPLAFNGLPASERQRVALLSLLGLAPSADLEITVAGWLGTGASDAVPTLPEIAKIDGRLIQCFYGADEEDSACPKLGSPVELIRTSGGHHFDGNYAALADKILSGYALRSASPVAAQ